MSETLGPSAVWFRGNYVRNNAAGKRRIDSIIEQVQTVYDAGGNAFETSPVPIRKDCVRMVVVVQSG